MSALEEPEAKEKYMRQLMMQLPEPNYSTAMFILDHLIKYVRSHRLNSRLLAEHVLIGCQIEFSER